VATPAPAQKATAPRPLAPGLSGVRGSRGRSDGPGSAPLLAVRPLAALRLGQLAAPGAPELQTLWCPLLLVAQPEKHRLQRLRDANLHTLTGYAKLGQKGLLT
jgi:hypothetical protein